MAMAVEDRVKKIIAEQLGVEEEEVVPEASFVQDLGADSLDTVELVMALEEEFDIEIPDEEAELDALLKAHEVQKEENARGQDKPVSKPSPVQELRQRFGQYFVPSVENLAQRLGKRGIVVQMDPSDFLGGGRGILIEVSFEGRGMLLEGTVLPDAIAFQETRFENESKSGGGRISGGPMLRTRSLTDEKFVKFLYERVIKLVQEVARRS